MAFFINTRMVYLGLKNDLCHDDIPVNLSSACYADRLTDGALKGKFSGSVSVKKNFPPLYGLSSYMNACDQ